MDSRGDTTVVWTRYDTESATAYIETSTRTTSTGEFTEPTTIWTAPSSYEEASKIQPKIAMDSSGETTIAWASHEGVRISTGPPGGPFGKAIGLHNPLVTEDGPAVVMDSRGDAVAVWELKSEASGRFALGSTAPAGEAFGTPVYISSAGLSMPEIPSSPLSVAIDSHGDAASAWVADEGEHEVVQVAGYQAQGPRLDALLAPSEGQMDSALAFSVSPLSVWSTVASTTWSWDDGTPDTTGTTVTHTFEASGTYQITVRASDAFGNTTTTTHIITIQTAPLTTHTPTPTQNTTQASPRLPHTTTPRSVVSTFTPLFATRASTNGQTLGLLVQIAAIRGVHTGEKIVIRCIAGCRSKLHETIHIRHHNTHSTIPITPPLVLNSSTRIEIQLSAPGHSTRYVQYRFNHTKRA